VPDVKGAEEEERGEATASSNDPLEQAMQEAVEAVEKRERATKGPEGEVELEVEAQAPAEGAAAEAPAQEGEKRGASDAVTEALINAKKELEEALDQTRKEAANIKNKWLRAAADLENFKKRAAKERDDTVKFGSERVLKDILPVLDDLDRTVKAIDNNEGTEAVFDGVKMVQKKFVLQLEKQGVEVFAALGQPFDPSRHEAVTQAHSADVPAGGVVSELRRGFLLHGRLLRPAMVVVSLGAPPAGGDGKSETGE